MLLPRCIQSPLVSSLPLKLSEVQLQPHDHTPSLCSSPYSPPYEDPQAKTTRLLSSKTKRTLPLLDFSGHTRQSDLGISIVE